MAEWLYEDGIGEHRAARIVAGRIAEARIERDDGGLRVGAVCIGRLGADDIVTLDDGSEAQLDRSPAGVSEGARVTIEIVRQALPEPGRTKRAKAIVSDAPPAPGPALRDRLDGAVRELRAHEPDALEAAGWAEVLDEGVTGEIDFPGGALRMSPTPAMTLFDVDGGGALEPLAVAAAIAVAEAIVRHGIGGSIGVDFPTVAGKAPRQAVAAALDAHLPKPFERTAVNGFGFLQIVRPRPRASLPELLRADPVTTAALATLRAIERTPPGSPNSHRLPAAVSARIAADPAWLAELMRRTGRTPIFDR